MCNHDDSDGEHLHSLDGHEHFMSTADADGDGNCCENYSTLERYLRNPNELSEDNDAWMNIEHQQNFLEQPQSSHHQHEPGPPPKNFDENLDIDDDGLIGFEPARQSSFSTFANDEHDEHDGHNIELISYENNFNLYNSFWWAMGTLIQTTSDLNPKVSLLTLLPSSRLLDQRKAKGDRNVDGYVKIAVLSFLVSFFCVKAFIARGLNFLTFSASLSVALFLSPFQYPPPPQVDSNYFR